MAKVNKKKKKSNRLKAINYIGSKKFDPFNSVKVKSNEGVNKSDKKPKKENKKPKKENKKSKVNNNNTRIDKKNNNNIEKLLGIDEGNKNTVNNKPLSIESRDKFIEKLSEEIQKEFGNNVVDAWNDINKVKEAANKVINKNPELKEASEEYLKSRTEAESEAKKDYTSVYKKFLKEISQDQDRTRDNNGNEYLGMDFNYRAYADAIADVFEAEAVSKGINPNDFKQAIRGIRDLEPWELYETDGKTRNGKYRRSRKFKSPREIANYAMSLCSKGTNTKVIDY